MRTPFNSDTFIPKRVEELIAKHRVRTIVETGTYHGATTEWFAPRCEVCVTIEKNPVHYLTSKHLERFPNVLRLCGDSRKLILRAKECPGQHLFYLDAHWGDWPVLGELGAIALMKLRPVIVIHDFKVEGLGCDSHEGQPLCLDYILPALTSIYPHFVYTTNAPDRADGSRRGCCYIEPHLEANASSSDLPDPYRSRPASGTGTAVL